MDPERRAAPQTASTGPAGSHHGVAAVDRQALLTVLTTEHFTLQGARASTVSESSARAALFVGAVTSTLVALGFIAQASELGSAFDTFVLVVLPTLYVLGLFTFVRLVTSSTEDLLYGRAINRIRNYYEQVAGDEASCTSRSPAWSRCSARSSAAAPSRSWRDSPARRWPWQPESAP
jgi:hypothetical protein